MYFRDFVTDAILVALVPFVTGTFRYYYTYLTYGSGDTIISNYHLHGGSKDPHHKWSCECMDGEAMRIQQTWCKHSFPNKPPANGLYPYYGSCHVRNYTDQYFCFDPKRPKQTINTMITAMWANNLYWFVSSPGGNDEQPYKCCEPPGGHYIDYLSCYFQPTHDQFFEYYDNNNMFIVYCAQGFVMTGIAKKINPYSKEYHIDWIQCCRIGVGPHKYTVPPVVYERKSGAAAYYAQRSDELYNPAINKAHLAQYRTSRSAYGDDEVDEFFLEKTMAVNEEELSQEDKHRIGTLKRRIVANKTKHELKSRGIFEGGFESGSF